MQQVAAPRSSCARGSIAALHVHQHFGGLPDVLFLPLNYPHSSMLRNVSQVAAPWTYKSRQMRERSLTCPVRATSLLSPNMALSAFLRRGILLTAVTLTALTLVNATEVMRRPPTFKNHPHSVDTQRKVNPHVVHKRATSGSKVQAAYFTNWYVVSQLDLRIFVLISVLGAYTVPISVSFHQKLCRPTH